jgi:hypothetical protein
MQIYINKDNINRIYVKDKVIANWVEFKKAKPEKKIFFGLITYRLATGDGWVNQNCFYAPKSLEEYRECYGKQYGLDVDGLTMIIKPNIVIQYINGSSETAYYDTYEAAVAQATYVAGLNPQLIQLV